MEQTGLPISFVISSANQHDSTKFIDTVENISDFLDDDGTKQIVSCFADKGYDSTAIREYLKNRNIKDCIPFRKTIIHNLKTNHTKNTTEFVMLWNDSLHG